jgi:hypothetical protein
MQEEEDFYYDLRGGNLCAVMIQKREAESSGAKLIHLLMLTGFPDGGQMETRCADIFFVCAQFWWAARRG